MNHFFLQYPQQPEYFYLMCKGNENVNYETTHRSDLFTEDKHLKMAEPTQCYKLNGSCLMGLTPI